MKRIPNPFTVITAVAAVGGIAMIWAGSIAHYADLDSSAAKSVADAAAHSSAYTFTAICEILAVICFGALAVGVVGIVRGRGQTFTRVAALTLVVGLPCHIIGATFKLMAATLATSSIPVSTQVEVVHRMQSLTGAYLAGIPPFLLALLLMPAALWRARAVSWVPFALMVVEFFGLTWFTSGLTPASWGWWLDPMVTVIAFGWIAWGLLTYRPQPVESAESTHEPGDAAHLEVAVQTV